MSIVQSLLNSLIPFRSSMSKVDKDFKEITENLEAWRKELIQIEKDELNDLSDFALVRPKFVRKGKFTVGLLGTVFEEAVMAFGYKEYSSKKMNALAVGIFKHRTFTFRYRAQAVDIYMNGKILGILNPYGILRSKGKVLARIAEESSLRYIVVGGREIASMNFSADRNALVKNRVVKFARPESFFEKSIILAFYSLGVIEKMNHQ